METIKISRNEYLQLQKKIEDLEKKLSFFQDEQFIKKMNFLYQFFVYQDDKYNFVVSEQENKLSLKRGSGKHIISDISDDFTETPMDFKDYM